MSEDISNITNLIRKNIHDGFIKDYNRIKSGKKFNIRFENYTQLYIQEMITHFEDISDYDKSSYLNLKLNIFNEK